MRSGHDLGDQFEALGRQLGSGPGQSGEIAVWARKVGDQLRRDWITCHHDNGNVARSILRRIDGRGLYRDEDVHPTANQFRRQFGEPTNLALRRSDLDLNIPSLNKTKIAQRFAKRPHGFRTTHEKYADPPQPLALLRTCRERPRDCATANECDEFAPPHCLSQFGKWIVAGQTGGLKVVKTPSAMSANGMVRPCSCPASDESGKGSKDKGARHVPELTQRSCRDRH
jgi:hypothetical protein